MQQCLASVTDDLLTVQKQTWAIWHLSSPQEAFFALASFTFLHTLLAEVTQTASYAVKCYCAFLFISHPIILSSSFTAMSTLFKFKHQSKKKKKSVAYSHVAFDWAKFMPETVLGKWLQGEGWVWTDFHSSSESWFVDPCRWCHVVELSPEEEVAVLLLRRHLYL